MGHDVLLGARRAEARRDHLTGRHVEVGDQALRPLTPLLKRASRDVAGDQGQSRMGPFEHVHRFLVGADRPHTLRR